MPEIYIMKIITAVVNNPDFIEIQNYTLKKYFKGVYEFIVFNDAKSFPDFTNGDDISIKSKIENTCQNLGIQCINIPNEHHKYITAPSQRCADSMNFILEYQKQNKDIYLFIDSDMFLVDDFDICKYESFDVAFILQQRGDIFYMWPQFYYFNMHKMKNFNIINWNLCPYCDCGGMSKYWIQQQFNNVTLSDVDKIRHFQDGYVLNDCFLVKHLCSLSWDNTELPESLKPNKALLEFLENDPRNKNGKYFCELYDNVFLHYRAGTNWMGEGMDFHKALSLKLKECLM